jgi:dTDP-4-amino-4,6-dideoxy-D-galactose acyltransferase
VLNTIKILEWDTKFFGYPVARIFLNHEGKHELDNLFRQLEEEKIRLTYFFVAPEEKEIIQQIISREGTMVDQKTVFLKQTEQHSEYSNPVIELRKGENANNLLDLAIQSGHLSRFHLDKNFINNEYERLYTTWITKSVNREIAFATLVVKKGKKAIGLITLGKKDSYADIGLLAVEPVYHGRGIGVDLIHRADTIAFEKGFTEIKVVTQLQNKAACKLYEKCNFHIESITNIYHYWQ